MSRRDQIRMTDEEVEAFLHGRHSMSVATIGPDGWPHLVAMWYGFHEGRPAFWTYGRSQKVVNLRRDPRLTVLVEVGEKYEELQGVEVVGTARILDDREGVLAVGASVYERYFGSLTDEGKGAVEAMSRKRVAVVVEPRRVVSWDHRKLAGAY